MVEFGRLSDVPLREGWAHEAQDFTPWLAKNLDRLSDAIGIPLELRAVEAKLPTLDDYFSADILAQTHTEDLVLIENQLEKSDHTHLGQIMTYLPALEAKTVVWVAPSFREAHLAAISWLNESTQEEYSFFAVQLRLVRIGDSAFAPLLDVLEKPNYWERHLQAEARAIQKTAPNAGAKEAFWKAFRTHYEVEDGDGLAKRGNTSWIAMPGSGLVISANLTQTGIVMFVRGPEGWTQEDVLNAISGHEATIEEALNVPADAGNNSGLFRDHLAGDYLNPSEHDDIARRLARRIADYQAAFAPVPPIDRKFSMETAE